MKRTVLNLPAVVLLLIVLPLSGFSQEWSYLHHGQGYPTGFATSESGQRIAAMYDPGGYWITHDGGQNWEPMDQAILPGNFMYQPERIVAVDPGADTLIVNATMHSYSAYGFMSTDAGATWSTLYIPGHKSNKWCTVRERGPNGRLYTTYSEELAYSDDEGETWTQLDIADYQYLPDNIALDPTDDQTVYMYGRIGGLNPAAGGVTVRSAQVSPRS